MPTEGQQALLDALTDDELLSLLYDWQFWGRPTQHPPSGVWRIWLILAGRGWGKTRTGAEWVRAKVESGACHRVALVNDTAADVRDVMVEGDSGLLAVCPPWNKPEYQPSNRRVVWPNGAMAICYAAESPELLRGPQHDGAWCDEPAKWKNLRKQDPEGGTAWSNLLMGLRIGENPQCVASTTPRAIAWMRDLVRDDGVVLTRGTSYENRGNLSPAWYTDVIRRYEGTRLGRQELEAELLDDVEGALWRREWIEASRRQAAPSLRRIVVAIDPATKDKKTSDETGIVVAGIGMDGHGYVLEDASGQYSPDKWAARAVQLYEKYGADRIVAEENQGGDMVAHTLRTVHRNVSYRGVHASKGKVARAEPVAALYEQGRVHHVGMHAALEDQLCTWDAMTGEGSPDRLDALVWALTDLALGGGPYVGFVV